MLAGYPRKPCMHNSACIDRAGGSPTSRDYSEIWRLPCLRGAGADVAAGDVVGGRAAQLADLAAELLLHAHLDLADALAGDAHAAAEVGQALAVVIAVRQQALLHDRALALVEPRPQVG